MFHKMIHSDVSYPLDKLYLILYYKIRNAANVVD